MLFDRGLRKGASAGPGAALGGVLTLENSSGWEGWTSDSSAAMSRDRAMKLSAVNRCVELRSCTMAMLPVYVMDEGAKDRLTDHRLKDVLWGQANEAMTWFDYERLMQCNLDLKGNAYAWINRDGRTGRPLELIPLHPDCVTPYVARDSSLWYFYTNPRTGEMCRLDPADVIHRKGYSKDGIEGISILRRAALTIQTGLSAQQYQREIYDNGGAPSGILTVATDLSGKPDIEVAKTDGTTEKISRKELIRREWEKIHTGSGNRFRIAVLDNGLKYDPLSMTNSDAQFVESEEVRVADVARFFAIPLHLLYAGAESYAANEMNSIELVKYTFLALVTQWEQEYSRKLLLPGERAARQRIKRELKMLLRGDTASQASWYETMRNIGVYNVDEIRALEDLCKVPGGETRYASLNYIPLAVFELLSLLRNMPQQTEH